MADNEYTTLELVGRHVPDEGAGPFATMNDATAAGYDVLHPVTGMYEIGALIDGQFVTFLTEKASLIFDRVQAGKDAQAAAAPDEPQQPAEQQPADTQPQA